MSDNPRVANPLGPLSSLRWWRMTLKELREILRDRRTIITLVGMPLLIYPLLGVTFQKLLVSQATNKTKIEYRVAFMTPHDADVFRRLFNNAEMLRTRKAGMKDPADHVPEGTADDPIWMFVVNDDPNVTVDVDQLVADRTADVGVHLKSDHDEGPWQLELSYRSGSSFSIDARRASKTDCVRLAK